MHEGTDQVEVGLDMAALIQAGAGIDSGEAAHAEAAASGQIDARGNIVRTDPDAAAMEWMFVPAIIAMIAKAILPETEAHYTDERCMELARAFVPVAEKYGWSGNAMSPEIGLAIAGFGFAMPAWLAYRVRRAAALVELEKAPDGS